MGKKGLTIDLETGQKKLETFIDDSIADSRDDVTFSGKYIKEKLVTNSHNANTIGQKTLDETNLQDSYVLKYDGTSDKIEYTKADDVISVIDCGTF